MNQEPIKVHVFNFSPDENSGESLYLETKFFRNEDGEVFTNQELTLHSHCKSASMNLSGIQITPEILRNLADELESKRPPNCIHRSIFVQW